MWVGGIFGNAAGGFDKQIRAYTSRLLEACNLDYETDLRAHLKDPAYGKATLGVLIAIIEEARHRKPMVLLAHVPGGWKASDFISSLKRINKTWADKKHGEEVPESTLIARMKLMLILTKILT